MTMWSFPSEVIDAVEKEIESIKIINVIKVVISC